MTPATDAPTAREDATIFAPATGFGRAAICVVRMTGPQVASVLRRLLGRKLPPPRHAALRGLIDPNSGDIVDRSIVIWFPGPNSFTGEDQAELHLHGGQAVRNAVLRALGEMPGCRPAEPGEFTRRAFRNGKLDLSAVEGMADLIDAETEAQRRQALRQMEGALARQVEAWRDRLIEASAYLEAALDFSDEGDVPAEVTSGTSHLLHSIQSEIEATLAEAGRGERLREGFVVVIAGPPNSGKSTLLNALARRDVAIVSPIAGTTRDAIEIRCDLDGLPVTFVDTAGLRDVSDAVESIGIERARRHIERADLVLWLTPGRHQDAEAASSVPYSGDAPLLCVTTMVDLAPGACVSADSSAISAMTGEGMPELIARVRDLAEAALVGGGTALITRERHRLALAEVAVALARANEMLYAGREELAAEDLRLAMRALGRITGRVDVEDVLDRIFGEFCIGK